MPDVPATTAEDIKRAWGETLAAARRDAGRTQMELSQALGLDQTTVSKAERGVGSLETFVTMAAELGVNILGTDP